MGKKYFFLSILFLILIFNGLSNFIWLKLDTRVPTDEAPFHLARLDIYDILRHPCSIKDKVSDIFARANYYPPFFFFTAAAVNIFFGTSLVSSLMANILYLIFLLFSVYQIGKKIDTASTGLLAAVIVSLYPAVFGLSRYFQIEFALCAMVTFSVYCLLYSENFRNMRYSLLFGISVGLGMLTKWIFAFFILGPLCCTIIEIIAGLRKENIKYRGINLFAGLKRPYQNSAYQLINIFLSFLAAFSIAGVYYIKFMQFNDLFRYANTESTGLRLFEIKNVFFYFFELINDQTSFYFFFIFILAVLLLKISRDKPKKTEALAAWILVPYLIFTFIFVRKSGVYIFSFIPAMALITAAGLIRIRGRLLKGIVVFTVILLGLLQYFGLSFGFGFTPKALSIDMPIGSIDLLYRPHFFYEPRYFANRIFCCPPLMAKNDRRAMDEALNCIEKYSNKSSEACLITLDPFAYSCKGLVFAPTWMVYLRERGKELLFNLQPLNPQSREFMRNYVSLLENSHFWITDDDVKKDVYIDLFREELREFDRFRVINNREVTEEELELFRKAIAKYELIKQIPFEKGASIYVYRRED